MPRTKPLGLGRSPPIWINSRVQAKRHLDSTNPTCEEEEGEGKKREVDLLIGRHFGDQQQFAIDRYMTKGSFGSLYFGRQLSTNLQVAVKVEPDSLPNKYKQLAIEADVLRQLQDLAHIPRLLFFGSIDASPVLVTELLGPTLGKKLADCGGRFSSATTARLLVQMIDLLRLVHERGFVHRDVKPDNFLLGPPEDTSKSTAVYLIDFGLTVRWRQPDGRHVPMSGRQPMCGTANFVSVNMHQRLAVSRRDDVESLAYVAVHLMNGRLPWCDVKHTDVREKIRLIGLRKKTTLFGEVCSGLPDAFRKLLEASRKLGFEQRPDYEEYKKWFEALVEGEPTDYDWIRVGSKENLKSKSTRVGC